MITKKTVNSALEAIGEIVEAFDQNTNFKDGLQESDFKKPFVAISRNGEMIYKTFNPLENSVYLGDEKLKFDWEVNPGNSDFSFALTQNFKDDDIKMIFSMDGNIVHAMESKPGENNLNAKLQLKIKV